MSGRNVGVFWSGGLRVEKKKCEGGVRQDLVLVLSVKEGIRNSSLSACSCCIAGRVSLEGVEMCPLLWPLWMVCEV
jgi:hypothetical protein